MAEAIVTEPLKYKTWHLKVSIHCEGCKRKVKKVLQSMEGVYMTTVDSQKQKVTVTGNIEAETLIKKLMIKTGKHAELWPEPKPSNPSSNANNDSGGGGQKKNKKNKNGDQPNGESLDDKPETKGPKPETATKKEEEEGKSSTGAESGKDVAKDSPNNEKPATKKKGKKDTNGTGGNNSNSNSGNAGKNGNGNGGNKGDDGGKAAAVQDNQKAEAVPRQQGLNLPMYPLPQHFVTYNNMQPVMAGSYYIPMAMPTVAAPAGSYDTFSEENANACIVM